MKILTTSLLLIITLLAVPVFSYFFGTAPGPHEREAIRALAIIAIASAACSFVVGELTRNNSQVDKLWSILPMVYAWVAAAYAGFSPRLVLMAALVTVWGIRLTVNFALKGAYTRKFWAGEEDYRWRVLRSKPAFKPRWKWTMFNLFFISGYQNALILLFTLPAVVAMQHPGALGVADLAVAVLMLFFIAYETMADIQQWRFQQSKKKAALTGNDPEGHLKRGFINRGLWAHSRHPNYFAEQAVWICFYLFSVSAGGQWFNWSISGCLLLIVLFQGSSAFGEEISAGKYPEYRDYQKRVPRFFPIPKKLISIDHC